MRRDPRGCPGSSRCEEPRPLLLRSRHTAGPELPASATSAAQGHVLPFNLHMVITELLGVTSENNSNQLKSLPLGVTQQLQEPAELGDQRGWPRSLPRSFQNNFDLVIISIPLRKAQPIKRRPGRGQGATAEDAAPSGWGRRSTSSIHLSRIQGGPARLDSLARLGPARLGPSRRPRSAAWAGAAVVFGPASPPATQERPWRRGKDFR